jgi:oligopeptidase B
MLMTRRLTVFVTLLAVGAACSHRAVAQSLAPPVARIVPRADTTLGDVRIDNYYWIRDDARKNPDVITYLDAENAYTEAVMKPLEALEENDQDR